MTSPLKTHARHNAHRGENTSRRSLNLLLPILSVTCMTFIAGCASGLSKDSALPATVQGIAIQGHVHGGQQPVAGSTLTFYAASTAGYKTAATNLLNTPVISDQNGGFTLTGDYTCTAGQMLYITATGGNPNGGGTSATTNPNLSLMAAVGECSTISSSTVISVNEVTTVAAAYALAPFMSSGSTVGSSATNSVGLAHAFTNFSKLVNLNSGIAPGPALPSGATIPTAELYALADILAACVNSTGGVAGDQTVCGQLFKNSVPSTYTALNPAKNFAFVSAQSPFQPTLSAAPSDWSIAIRYTGSGLSKPTTTTVDANGNLWVANSGNNSVTVLSQNGVPVSGSPFNGNGLSSPASIAMDAAGNGWAANKSGTSVSVFTPSGAPLSGSPFLGNGSISTPVSIAIDGPGNIWIANIGNQSITELDKNGQFITKLSTGSATPSALAVDSN
jgi:hypothetical protein